MLGTSPQICLSFQDFQVGSLKNQTNFKFIPVIFQHSLFTHCIALVKDKNSFYEIRSLAIRVNIKTSNRVKRKILNILKTFLEYLEFQIVTY